VKLSTEAVLLRRVDRGEADLLVTLFTQTHGKLTTIAFNAKRSKRRFAALETFHTMQIEADDGREMPTLNGAHIVRPRLGYLKSLDRMRMAGQALRWIREACPERAPEEEVWRLLHAYLDTALVCEERDLTAETAAFGLILVRTLGWSPLPSSVRSGMDPARAVRVVEDTIRANVS
jgi:DNA repair protein RecO (recombination protein O)